MNEINRKTSEPFTTGQFFLVTLVLGVTSFIPLIGWLSAAFLLIWVVLWILVDTRGFLSVAWRTILGAVLLSSISILSVYLPGPGTYDDKTQFVTAGAIGFALSAFGLVRSILKARTIS